MEADNPEMEMQSELGWKKTVKVRINKRWSRNRNRTDEGERIAPSTWHYKMVDNTLESYLSKWKIRFFMVKSVEKDMKKDELLAEYEWIILSDAWDNLLEWDRYLIADRRNPTPDMTVGMLTEMVRTCRTVIDSSQKKSRNDG